MAEVSLSEELTATLQQLDALITQHQEGQEYVGTQERLAWFHALVIQLQDDLVAFRTIALSGKVGYHGRCGEEIWCKTRDELRSHEPRTFRSPAQALIVSHVDLLDLVSYVVWARTVLQERQAWLKEQESME